MDMDPLEESSTEPPTEAPTRAPSPKANPAMNDFFASFSLGDPPKKTAPNGANGAAPSPLKQVASPGSISPTKVETPENEAGEKDGDKDGDKGKGKEESKDDKKDDKAEKKDVDDPPPSSPQAPKKVGNLMKELRNDVQQGAMEFNMDNFF